MITVVGERDGKVVASFPLRHGADPDRELAARGWIGSVVSVAGRAPDLTLRYAVGQGPVAPTEPIVTGPGERRQRVAAYALVRHAGAVLLTELSQRVSGGAGLWVLPGGGVDQGEEPGSSVVREVWEETGQQVDEVRLVAVSTVHRPGPSAWGEGDFHAVRLLHVARCERPVPVIVHDVGGSTASAAWVSTSALTDLPLAPWCSDFLLSQGLPTGLGA